MHTHFACSHLSHHHHPLNPITQAGFNHDYRSVERDIPEYTHLLRVLPRCFTEVMLRVVNPLRPLAPRRFKNGEKGGCPLAVRCTS
jgi:hypothetical protein